MKLVKLKKKYLNDLEFMYHDLGLVKDNSTNPSAVYMSEDDLKLLRKNIKNSFKKEYPELNSKKIASCTAMYLLNLEPNSSLSKAIKKGYLLIEN